MSGGGGGGGGGGEKDFMKYSYLDLQADDAYNREAADSIVVFTDGVLRGENRDAELLDVYGLVYGIVLLGCPDRPYRLLARCLSCRLTVVGDQLRRADGPALLAATRRAWDRHVAAAASIGNAFAYADSIARRRGSAGSRDLALNSFRDMLTGRRYCSVVERLCAAIVRSVADSRPSQSQSQSQSQAPSPCPEAVACCRMMLTLRSRSHDDSPPLTGRQTNIGDCRTPGQSLFKKYLERRLMDELNRYLDGLDYAGVVTVADHADFAAAVIDAETDRARALFGDGPGGARATAAVRRWTTERLVAWRRRFFVESETGLWTMMAAGRVDQAARVYRLLMRLDRQRGAAIVEDAVYRYAHDRYCDAASASRRRFVADMISWQATAARLLPDAFDDHPGVGQLIDRHLAHMLHSDRGFVECASLYVEDLATGGGGDGRDDNDDVDDGVFALIRRLNATAKDAFEVHYRNRLARRLLRLDDCSVRERDVVCRRLVGSLGAHRTRKLRTMLADLDSSAELVVAFNQQYGYDSTGFDVRVLDVRAWPIAEEPARCSLPDALVRLFTMFRQFDCNTYGDNRKIVFIPQLSTADLVIGARVVRVSLFSAVVLSLFNGHRVALSYRDVSAASSIAPLQLKATLAALVDRGLLTKTPQHGSRAAGPDDYVFRPTDCRGRRTGFDDDDAAAAAVIVILDDVAF